VRHVVLLGLVGTGKTSIGTRLAHDLQRPFSDSDTQLQHDGAGTAAQRAERVGLDALHELEHRMLLESLDSTTAVVIAAAASVLDDPDLTMHLTDHLVVGLVASEATMRARFRSSGHRPALGPDPLGTRSMRSRRLDALERACRRVVQTDDRSSERIAADLATWVVEQE